MGYAGRIGIHLANVISLMLATLIICADGNSYPTRVVACNVYAVNYSSYQDIICIFD